MPEPSQERETRNADGLAADCCVPRRTAELKRGPSYVRHEYQSSQKKEVQRKERGK
jgi:hypothetical protein